MKEKISFLSLFLQTLFVGNDIDVKIASVGQTIVQAVRPRVVAPLQIGLGIQMHRQFGSRFLIDSLNRHGFSSSYTEVQKYERSAAANRGTEILGFTPGRFIQHVADNVDHNLRTLDGLNAFHGRGILTTVTPGTQSRQPVLRVTVSSEDICAVGTIDINCYKPHHNGLTSLKYKPLFNSTSSK